MRRLIAAVGFEDRLLAHGGDGTGKGSDEDGREDTDENDPPSVASVVVTDGDGPLVSVTDGRCVRLLASAARVNSDERVGTGEGTKIGGRVVHIHVVDAEVVERAQILDRLDIKVSSSDNDTVGLHGESSSDVEGRIEANNGEGLGDGESEVSKDSDLTGNGKTTSVRTRDDNVSIGASGVGELRRDQGTVASGAVGDVGGAAERVGPSKLASAARVVGANGRSLTSQ